MYRLIVSLVVVMAMASSAIGQMTTRLTPALDCLDPCVSICGATVVYCSFPIDQEEPPASKGLAEPKSVLVSPAPVASPSTAPATKVQPMANPEVTLTPAQPTPPVQAGNRRSGVGNNASLPFRGGLLNRILNRRR